MAGNPVVGPRRSDVAGNPLVGERGLAPNSDVALDGGRKSTADASIEAGKTRAAEAVKRSEGSNVQESAPKGPSFTWSGETSTRPSWLAPDNYVEKRTGPADNLGVRQAAVSAPRANVKPPWDETVYSSTDPWNPSGEAQSQGQLESDFLAHDIINARQKQALDAIDARQASRPDSNAEAVKNAQATRDIAIANTFAKDPFAQGRFATDEAIRADRGRQETAAGIGNQRAGQYAQGEQQRATDIQALKSDPRWATTPPEKQREILDALNARYDAALAALDRGYGKITAKAAPFGEGGGGFGG
jgi:hypothetical protein